VFNLQPCWYDRGNEQFAVFKVIIRTAGQPSLLRKLNLVIRLKMLETGTFYSAIISLYIHNTHAHTCTYVCILYSVYPSTSQFLSVLRCLWHEISALVWAICCLPFFQLVLITLIMGSSTLNWDVRLDGRVAFWMSRCSWLLRIIVEGLWRLLSRISECACSNSDCTQTNNLF
jgi:hypothetical protein